MKNKKLLAVILIAVGSLQLTACSSVQNVSSIVNSIEIDEETGKMTVDLNVVKENLDSIQSEMEQVANEAYEKGEQFYYENEDDIKDIGNKLLDLMDSYNKLGTAYGDESSSTDTNAESSSESTTESSDKTE
jgi:hypothetical protein